ncbi:MaoC family dehydratase [Nakamurella silvestris]|nr:MaoC family dehydratase [Nakamurella silvestris]
MPLDPTYVGRSFPGAEPFAVGAEIIRQFAVAIGDDNPLYHDKVAAQSAGHLDVVAPPTFAIRVIARAQDAVMFDPALGLDFSMVVHRDQSFVHHRPIVAGDELSAVVHIDAIRVLAGNDVLTVRTEVTDSHDTPVCTAVGTLVARAS